MPRELGATLKGVFHVGGSLRCTAEQMFYPKNTNECQDVGGRRPNLEILPLVAPVILSALVFSALGRKIAI